MKKSYIILATAIVLILALAFLFLHEYFQISSPIYSSYNNKKLLESIKNPEYHFVVIAQNTDDPFWQSVGKGVFEAAKKFNVAVEFNGPRFTNLSEELQYLDIAIASRVDGIVTHVLDELQFAPIIDKAVKMNIPVITIESDAKKSKRISFIGTNNFQLGAEGGKLMVEATGGKAKVAVVLNSYSNESGDVSQNLKITGFRDVIKGTNVEIKTIMSSSMGILSAGEVTYEIINHNSDINAIFCTNAKDTVGAAQVVVDLNKVGDISIIGYGDLPEILHYIEKGVIYGTVVSNPIDMGYESIKALVEIKEKNRTSSYIDTGVHSVTNKNLAEYTKISESQKGQDSISD